MHLYLMRLHFQRPTEEAGGNAAFPRHAQEESQRGKNEKKGRMGRERSTTSEQGGHSRSGAW